MPVRRVLRHILLFPLDLLWLGVDWLRVAWTRLERPFQRLFKRPRKICPLCRDIGSGYVNKTGRSCYASRKYCSERLAKGLCAGLAPGKYGDAPFECNHPEPATGPIGPFFRVGMILLLVGVVAAGTLQVQMNFFPRAVKKVRRTVFGPPLPAGLATDPALRELQIRLLKLSGKETKPNPELAALYETQGDRHLEEDSLRLARLEYAIAAELNPTNAPLWHKLGLTYLKLGAADFAQQSFEKEIELGGDTGGAHGALAVVHGLRGRTEEALEHALKAHDLSEDGSATALLELLNLYTQRRELEAADAVAEAALERDGENAITLSAIAQAIVKFGNPRGGEPYFRQALERQENHIPSLLGLADVLVRQNSIDEAEGIVEQVLAISPEILPAHALKVEIARRRSGNPAAISLLEALSEEHPDFAWARTRLGELLLLSGNFDRAHQIASELSEAEAFRTRWDGLWLLTRMFFAQGLHKKALETSAPLVEQNPFTIEARMLRAQAFTIRKEYQAAISLLNDTIRRFPEYKPAYLRLCEVLVLLGDQEQADQVLDRVMAQQEESSASYKLKGDYYLLSANDPENARIAYEKAIELAPENRGLRYDYIHLLTEQLKDLDTAENLAREIQQDHPGDPAFKNLLGWVYYRQGRLDQALPLLEQAVASAPQVSVFRHHLGTALHGLNRLPEAERELRTALAIKPGFFGANDARELLLEMERGEGQ